MNNEFNSYPILDDLQLASLGYIQDYSFFYIDNNNLPKPLNSEVENDCSNYYQRIKVEDHLCSWNIETCPTFIKLKCKITSFSNLFGLGGICPSSATLGIALRWSSPQTSEQGVIPLEELKINSPSVEFEIDVQFEKGMLKGALKLQTILYLKDLGYPSPLELYFAQQTGVVLGILSTSEVLLEGSGSLFPIVERSKENGLLWEVWYDEMSDILEDKFLDKVEISINPLHPNYNLLKIRSTINESPFFIEFISAALVIVIESIKRSCDDDLINIINSQTHFNSGSIAEAMYYFVNKLEWDISSPNELSASIRKFFEKGQNT